MPRWEPTAQALEAETAATLFRLFALTPTLGLGWTIQRRPFQCSMKVRLGGVLFW